MFETVNVDEDYVKEYENDEDSVKTEKVLVTEEESGILDSSEYYQTEYEMDYEEDVVDSAAETLLKCPGCFFVSTAKERVTFHFQMRHLLFKFECGECFFAAANPESLDEHFKLNHGSISLDNPRDETNSAGVKCWLCFFESGAREELKKHLKKVHGAELGLLYLNK